MRYPPEFLELLRDRILVSEVVGRRISIQKKGREFSGLCPFHKENTPSFTVNDDKGFYHCFGCGAHGDAIGFIKEYEGVSYKDSIERLANEAGVALPKLSKEQEAHYKRVNSLHDVMEWACAWFEQQYQSASGVEARNYLMNRGLSNEICKEFRIGYAPANRDILAQYLLDKGASEQQLIEAGLLIQIEGKKPYSRFRDRVMFPIRNRRGQVIAFGGRLLRTDPDNRAPKYLNSPETPLFHKGQTLYNIDIAQKMVRDGAELIVCEGYTDVIALAQAGIRGAVAPLGTAVTDNQLHLMWQLTDKPLICLDGDNAGMRAMHRASELALPLLQPGKSVEFILLPAGEDPDNIVRHQGRDAMMHLCSQALGLADVLLQQARANSDDTPDGRAKTEALVMAQVLRIENATVQHYYRNYFKEQLRPKKIWGGKEASHGAISVKVSAPQENTAEQTLALILIAPFLLDEGEVEEGLATIIVRHSRMQSLQQALLGLVGQELTTTADVIDRIDEDNRQLVNTLVSRHKMGFPAMLRADAEHAEIQKTIAMRSWHYVMTNYDLARAEQECLEAQLALSADMSDDNLVKYQKLNSQKDALMQRRDMLLMQHSLDAEAI